MAVLLRRGALLGVIALLAGYGTTAQAAPFGLQVGDEIVQIEWDALQSVAGDGGSWDASQEHFHADGRVTAVNLTAGSPSQPSLLPTNSTLAFDLGLTSQSLYVNLTTQQAYANALMPGFFLVLPSFQVFEGATSVLEGQFVGGGVYIEGNIDLTTNAAQILTGTGAINITGGDSNLVNALGGMGAGAEVILSFSTFNFAPPLQNLVLSGNVWGQDFQLSMSGTVSPFNPAPFVPEPSTALMLGGGLIGLLGASRRLKNRS